VSPEDILAGYHEFGFDLSLNPLCRFNFLTRAGLLRQIIGEKLRHQQPISYVSHVPLNFERTPEQLDAMRADLLREQRWSSRQYFHASLLEMSADKLQTARQILERIRNYVQQHHARLILVDLPVNKSWYDRYFDWNDSKEMLYRSATEKLKEEGFQYYDWRWDKDFVYADFYDDHHMVQSGRNKILPLYLHAISKARN
jgi:hypothetical protein